MGRKRKAVEYKLPPGKLWPNTPSGAEMAIEVFGATGPYESGKTLLGLSIAPGAHPEGHEFAGKPRTLCLDFEKSSGTYGGTGCKRIDVPGEMLKLFTDDQTGKVREYKPLDIFEWFLRLIDRLPPGRFDVVMADPITDIEGGLVSYVKKNCKQFGLTENQIAKAGGLLWGAVKDYWKQVLLRLSTKCQTFYFTTHLRSVWDGDRPVRGKKEPKGKDTLMELSSLYLWLERKPDDKGDVLAVPSARCAEPYGKSRLADAVMTDDGRLDITRLIPPRLPEATVEAIREYIAQPPDRQKLREDERVVEDCLSDDDKLRMKESTALAEATAQEGRLAVLTRQAEIQAAARRGEQTAPQPSDVPGQPVKQAAADAEQGEKAAAEAAEKRRKDTYEALKAKADAEQAEIDADMKEAEAGVVAGAAEGQRLVDSQPEEHQPAAGPAVVSAITDDQIIELRKLVEELGIGREKLAEILAKVDRPTVRDLSRDQAARLIDKLKAAWLKKESAKN